jgi:hypothetical protein
MVAEKIKYRTGTMTKSPFDMDDAEYKIWQEKGKIETREYLFSIGQPLIYFIDNQVVIENSDGTIEYINR